MAEGGKDLIPRVQGSTNHFERFRKKCVGLPGRIRYEWTLPVERRLSLSCHMFFMVAEINLIGLVVVMWINGIHSPGPGVQPWSLHSKLWVCCFMDNRQFSRKQYQPTNQSATLPMYNLYHFSVLLICETLNHILSMVCRIPEMSQVGPLELL